METLKALFIIQCLFFKDFGKLIIILIKTSEISTSRNSSTNIHQMTVQRFRKYQPYFVYFKGFITYKFYIYVKSRRFVIFYIEPWSRLTTILLFVWKHLFHKSFVTYRNSSNWRQKLLKRSNLEPKFSVRAKTEAEAIGDGYKWRKYGQKIIKNCSFPR